MWRDMDWTPYDWFKSSTVVMWQLKPLLLMGMALELMYVVETNPIRVS